MTPPRWLRPLSEPTRATTIAERGRLLVDLLELVDALPPVEKRPLDAPTFRQLCERS